VSALVIVAVPDSGKVFRAVRAGIRAFTWVGPKMNSQVSALTEGFCAMRTNELRTYFG
jgi:phage-related protein